MSTKSSFFVTKFTLKKNLNLRFLIVSWCRRTDSNRGHCGYEPHALANWATPAKYGADDQDWTGDLILTKDTLCRLSYISILNWLRGADLNHRPSGYEPDELPTALPRDVCECKGKALFWIRQIFLPNGTFPQLLLSLQDCTQRRVVWHLKDRKWERLFWQATGLRAGST